jgi:hypothetical protein
MKLINFALIFVLVLLLALSAPARTQTTDSTSSPLTDIVQLPAGLNIAMCVNDWDKALNIVQKLLGDTITAESRQQLVTLRSKLEDYRARGVKIDQSNECAAAIPAAGQSERTSNRGSSSSSRNCNSSRHITADGRCFANRAAKKRHERSLVNGDRPSSELLQQ